MNAIESTLLETLEDAKENVERAFAHRRRVVEGHEKALAQARRTKDAFYAKIPTTLIMEELDPPRETFVLVRGDFRTRGERVEPGTPSFLPPLPEGPTSVTNAPAGMSTSTASSTRRSPYRNETLSKRKPVPITGSAPAGRSSSSALASAMVRRMDQ